MSDSVAFETEFLRAFKRVVGVLAAEDTVKAESFVGAILLEVPELFAVATFYRRVVS